MAKKLGAIHTPLPSYVPMLNERARLDLMTVPKEADWFKGAPPDGDALANDQYGCCVPAEDYQEIRLRRANAAGDTWKPTASLVLARYARMTGFNLVTGTPDEGTDTSVDTIDYCSKGIQVNSQTLDVPHVAILNKDNRNDMKIAVAHLCAVAATLALPLALQDEDFSRPPGTGPSWVPGSWGLHRVLFGKLIDDTFFMRSWGNDYEVHPEIMDLILLAAETRISRNWLETTGLAPSGLSWDDLMLDRAKLAAV
jgi:hypothetical protein